MRKPLLKKLFLLAFLSFTTLSFAQNLNCTTISTFPYSQNFDDSTWVSGAGFGNTGDAIDTCWTRNPTSPSFFWGTRTGATGSSGTGPSAAYNGANYIFTEGSNGATVPAYINMPAIDLTSLTSPQMDFYYFMLGNNMGTLEVEASVDSGATWTSVFSISGQQHSASDPWSKALVNLTSYKSAYTFIRFKGVKGSGFASDMAVDAIQIAEAPACPQPTNLTVSNVLATEVTAKWSSVAAATSYTVIYGLTGFDPATGGTSTTSTVDSLVITGLTAASDYDYYLISDCGVAGISDTSGPVTFTTACAPIALPYSQNFDSTPAGGFGNPSLPNCWSFYTSANGYLYTAGFTANSAPNSLYLYNSTGTTLNDTLLAISPDLIGLDSSDKQLTFWSIDGSSFSDEGVVVGTMADPLDASTFHPLDTVVLTDNYSEYIYYLDSASGYNGTDKHVAFAHAQRATFSSIYLDDIVIDDIPACPKPTSVALSNVTSSTALLTFSSSGSSWPIEYGPTGFVQSTGFTDTATSTSYTIMGLPAASTLDFYIQNDCSPNNGVSSWTGPYTITTKCNTQSLPYSQNFDSWPPTCWSVDLGTQPVVSHSSGSAMFNYWSFNVGNNMVMQSAAIDVSVDARIKFKWSHLYSSSYPLDGMTLRIKEAGTSTWDTLWSKFGTDFNSNDGAGNTSPGSFVQESLNLNSSWTNKDVEVEFFGSSGFGPDAFIDDFLIEAQPTCLESDSGMTSGVVDTSATVSWVAGGGSAWKVEVGPAGFTQGTGMMTNTATTSVTLSGLTPSTCYDVYVQDSCGAGSFSPWYGPISFCTTCSIKTAPWSDDLDGGGWVADDVNFSAANSILDPCWSRNPDVGTAYTWNVRSIATGSGSTGPSSDKSGTGNYIYVESSPASLGAFADLMTPFVDVSGLTTPQLEFWYHFYGAQIDKMLIEGYDGVTWTTLDSIVGQKQSASTDAWLKHAMVLNYTTIVQIRFRFVGVSCCSGDGALDEISIKEAPLCPDPQQVNATLLQGYSADIAWTGPSNSQQYYVEYGLTGFVQGTGGGTLDSTLTNSYTVAGLIPTTCYDIYVQSDCGSASGTSQWVGPYSFCTTVSCPTPSGIVLNDVGTTDAWLQWTSGGAANWDYVIGVSPMVPSGQAHVAAASDSINVTGLTPATTYDFYVRDSCGVGDVSTWVGPFTFSTECTTFSLNYSEDFNAWPSGGNLACWTEGGTMPATRYSNSGNIMTAFQFWSYNNAEVNWTSPEVNISARAMLRFKWSKAYSASYPDDSVYVLAKTTSATTWDTLAAWGGTTFDCNCGAGNTAPGTMVEDTFALDSSYVNQDIQVRFSGVSDWGPDFFLDDVNIDVDPSFSTCPNPSNLAVSNVTTTTADVGWTAGGSGTSWQLSYGIGTTAGGGTIVTTTSNPYSLTNIMPSSVYNVYVREICSAGDTSVWSAATVFNTPCVASPMPYNLGFTTWPPICVDLTGGTFNWAQYGSNGATADFWNVQTGDAWLTTNEVVVSSNGQLRYEWSRNTSVTYSDSLYILGRSVSSSTWDTLEVRGGATLHSNDGATNTAPGSYVADSIALPSIYVGDTIVVAFVAVSNWGPSLFLKSINIEAGGAGTNGCGAASNVMTTVGCDTAMVTWTSDTATVLTVVRYGAAGFDHTDTAQGSTVLGISPLTITGLTPGTAYDIWILDSCATGWSATMDSIVTATAPIPSIAYSYIQSDTTLTSGDVDFDASATMDGSTFAWDFGGGNTAMGAMVTYSYSSNGTYPVTLTVTNGCGSSDTTFNVVLEGIGLEESLLNESLKVYPNPSSGEFNVSFELSSSEEIEITILNAAGQIILTDELGNVGGQIEASYDLSNEAKGIYILNIKTSEGVISKRVSIQ